MRREIRVAVDSAGYGESYTVIWLSVVGEPVEQYVRPFLPFATTPQQALRLALEELPVQPELPGFGGQAPEVPCSICGFPAGDHEALPD